MAKRNREKVKRRLEEKDTRPSARVRHIRIAAPKVRAVLDVVRGVKYAQAVAILDNTPSGASLAVKKLIESAAANAEVKNFSKHDLYVAEIFADEGPTLKRMMARGKGSSNRIDKRTCHITVVLDAAGGEK